MLKKEFVPCYRVTFKFFDIPGNVFRCSSFEVDYFLRDQHGVLMYERIQDEWCIPYIKTSVDFERIK